MDRIRSALAPILLAGILVALLLAPGGASAGAGETASATASGAQTAPQRAERRVRRAARRVRACDRLMRRARSGNGRAATRRRVRRTRRVCVHRRAALKRARRLSHRLDRRLSRRRLARLRSARTQSRRAVADQVAVSAPAATVSETPGILFRGDFERGFDQWHVQSLDYRASLVPGIQGAQGGRFEVHEGDVEPETGSQRSEVSGPTFDEGQDLYIRDAIRVTGSNSFKGPWQIVQQLHEVDWNGSPGLAVFLDEDDELSIGAGDGSETFWDGEELDRDRWYDLIYRVYLSRDEDLGFVEVWLDGAQQRLDDGETRAYGETIQTPQTYLKAGIYRSSSSSGVSAVEHDAILVGTSYAAVAAG